MGAEGCWRDTRQRHPGLRRIRHRRLLRVVLLPSLRLPQDTGAEDEARPEDGGMPFKGPLDCAWKQVQAGGPLRLWSGFPTYYARIAPHAMVTLIAQDNIKKFWGSVGL